MPRGNLLRDQILDIFYQSARIKEKFLAEHAQVLEDVVRAIAEVLSRGNKIVLFGNGGSAADAQHIAAEFVNRYLTDRPPLAALALTTDTSILTAVANDFSYEEIFEKQIRALGKRGDAALGISTSGKSRNVIKGLETARELGLVVIGLGGPADSPMKQPCHHFICVEGGPTPRIQEVHLLIAHTVVEMVDRMLFRPGTQH